MKLAFLMALMAVLATFALECTPAPPPTLTSTPGPTHVPSHPTATPALTAIAHPTATSSLGVTPAPTATPIPTPVPSPTAAPSPTPEPTPIKLPVSPTPSYTSPTVVIGDAAIPVEVAVTPEQRQQGLSGRPSLASGAGMLFVFESPMPLQFWMKRMQFPLDFVWIGADCTIGEITRDVPPPPPGTKDSDLTRISPQGDTQYVLEINAGEAAVLGLEPSQSIVFAGSIDGRYGC